MAEIDLYNNDGYTDMDRPRPLNSEPLEVLHRKTNEFSDSKLNYELVEQTEVSNFEDIWFNEISTREVADYLKEYIPPSHLKNCLEIKYDSKPHSDSVFILGETIPNANGQKIIIYAPNVWLKSPELAKQEILDTLTHEIGHNVHLNLSRENPNLCQEWQNIYRESKGYVSGYATTTWEEDFAESYRAYIRDPELLNIVNPEKYAFMKENIFSGREFLDITSKDLARFYQVTISNYFEACKQGAVTGLVIDGRDRTQNQEVNTSIDTLSEFYKVRMSPESLKPILKVLLEQHKNTLEPLLNDILNEKLDNPLKNTEFNFFELQDTRITAVEDGFKIEGNFTFKHREVLFDLGPLGGSKHFTPWITENGQLTIPLSAKLEQEKVLIEIKKPNIALTTGDFITLINLAEPLWKDKTENKVKDVLQNKFNQLFADKNLEDLVALLHD